jgi:TM2 domain-containing membrane protein YozV
MVPAPAQRAMSSRRVCSFFIPGLGQLTQGRVLMALIQFVLAGILWIFLLGWLIHLWSVIDAALYRG